MDKTNPPKTFGVFKPVGHTVIAYPSDADLQAAVNLLTEAGFANSTWVRYTPAEMKAQVDSELQTASPAARAAVQTGFVGGPGASSRLMRVKRQPARRCFEV